MQQNIVWKIVRRYKLGAGCKFEKKPDSYQQIINLDEPINTQHVRLFIEEFDPKGAPENGAEVTWNTVGIWEFETYAGKLEEPENTQDPQEVADNLELLNRSKVILRNLQCRKFRKGLK